MAEKKGYPGTFGQQQQQQQPHPSSHMPTAPQFPGAGQYQVQYLPQQPGQMMGGMQAMYQAAPPTYEQALAHPLANAAQPASTNTTWMYSGGQPIYTNYPAIPMTTQAYMPGVYAAPGYYPMPHQQAHQPHQHMGPTYVMPATYDGGARFDGVSQPRIPPAPPGVAPNAAQMAAQSGHSVQVASKKKGNFFTGNSDGGFTFW